MADDNNKLKRAAVAGLAVVAAVSSVNYSGLFADEVNQSAVSGLGDGVKDSPIPKDLSKEVKTASESNIKDTLTNDDIGIVATLKDGRIEGDKLISAGNMSVHVAVSTLCEGPSITRIGLMKRTGEDVDSGVEENVDGVEGDFSLAGYKNQGYNVYTVTVYLDNGQRLLFDLSALVPGLEGVTNHIEDIANPVVEFLSGSWEMANGYINRDGVSTFSVTDADSGVKSVTANVDGEQFEYNYDASSGEFTFNTEQFQDGSHTLSFTVVDNAGNTLSHDHIFKIKRVAPEITGAGYSACVNVEGKTLYKDILTLSFGGYNNENIARIVVKDTESTWEKEVDLNTGSVSVDASGSCVVEVIDVADNNRIYTLSQLFPELSDTIERDSELPTASIEFMTEGKNGWFKNPEEAVIRLHYGDNNGIAEAKVSVNGAESVVSLVEGTDYAELSLSDYDEPEDGVYNITFRSTDLVGNQSDIQVARICVDTELPEVKAVSYIATLREVDGKVYIANKIDISMSVEDKPSGVESVELMKGEDVIEEISNGTVSISEDGQYYIKVTDIAGNVTSKTLKDLLEFESNEFVFDKFAPEISATLNDSADNFDKWVSGAGNLKLAFSDDTLLSGVEVYINGNLYEQQLEGSSDEMLIDLLDGSVPTPNNGIYNITVNCQDHLGNRSSESYVVKLDLDSPEIAGIKVSGTREEYNGNLYVRGNLSITCNADDDKSGVKSVELVKDGKVVATGSNFTVDSDGVYSVRVTNNVGLVTEKTLADLMGIQFNKVFIDNEAPSMSATLNGSELTQSWTINNAILRIALTDNVKLSSVYVNANGEEFLYPLDGREQMIVLDLSKLNRAENGVYDITVKASDLLGNESSPVSYSVKADFDSPAINGIRTEGVFKEFKGTVYVKGSLKIVCDSSDIGSGVEKIELLNGEEVVSTGDSLLLKADGDYSIKVTDKAGLFTTYRLQDLLGTSVSNVVIDTEPPEVKVDVDGKPVSNAWLTGSAKLNVQFEDNYGLESVKVIINGEEYGSEVAGNETGFGVTVDLRSVKRAKDGLYKVKVEGTDILGNVSNVREFTIKADFDNPLPGTLTAKGSHVEYSGVVYVDGGITVSGTPKDIGSGVKTVELLKGTEVVSSTLPFKINSNGTYTVRITDNAGLKTVVGLNQFLGTVSNQIVIDNEVPTVVRESGFKPDVVSDGKNWYKTFPSLVYDIKDTNLRNVKILVNGVEKGKNDPGSSLYRVDTAGLTGEVSVIVEAYDCYGHKTEDSFNYIVDKTAPKCTDATFSTDFKSRGGVLFFKSSPVLTVVSKDTGVGVKEFILHNKEDGSKQKLGGNTPTANFKLGSGEYSVEVKDKLGNTSGAVALKDIMEKVSTSKIIVDTEKPVIKVTKPKGRVNNWYNKDVDFKFDLKDNQGIHSATVKVNGKVVDSFKADGINTTAKEVHALTKGIEAEKGGMYVVKVEVVDNAGNKSDWSDTFYLDKKAPKVTKFVFSGKGVQEGKDIGGSNKYGYYFEGKASCEIFVSDANPSSGLDKLYVSYSKAGGKGAELKEYKIVGGSVKIDLPNNFKGSISACATDKAGNRGAEARPDSVITEDGNVFINSTSIDITLPDVESVDASGLPLYNDDIMVTADVRSDWAGIRKLEWGIGEKVLGTVEVDNNGRITGDEAQVTRKEGNLRLNLLKGLEVTGNLNNMEVWVKVKDRTGQESRNSKIFSIDRDMPSISVDYNVYGEYCNESVVASITVKERNFDPARFIVSGDNIGSMGSWVNEGDTWKNTLTLEGDGVYGFSLACTDRAGNTSDSYDSETIIVDKTAPTVNVSWDDAEPTNEGFYNKPRTATVTVTERNFDPDMIVLDTGGNDSGWISDGDVHTNQVTFEGSGEFALKVRGTDLAGNVMAEYSSESFIIDTEPPVITISGVEQGVSYKAKAGFSVKIEDTYLDPNQVSVSLIGKKNGEVKLEGKVNGKTGEFVIEDFEKKASKDDIYTLKVEAKDKAGNKAKSKVVFSVNRFGSSYEFLETNLLNNYLKSPKSITITESNVDRLDKSKIRVEVLLDGKAVKVGKDDIKIAETENDKGKFKYTYSIDKRVFSKDGKYLIQVFSCAEEGTTYSSVSEEYAFILDTTPPEVIVSGIETGGKYYEYERDVAIDIRDLTGIESLSIKLNGKEIKPSKTKGIYSFKIQESNKSQTLLVEATDKAGNLCMVEIKDFTISSSTWVYLVNQIWFKLGIGAAIAVLAALIALIIGNRRKSRRDEDEALQEHAEMIHSSSASSSSLGSADTKDEAEELDKQ